MTRRFFRDSAIYAIPAVLTNGISFFLFPFYAHRFTRHEYGVFDLLTLANMLVGWTVAFEIYQGVGRFTVGEADRARVRAYASTGMWFAIGAYGLFAVVSEALATPSRRFCSAKPLRVSPISRLRGWRSAVSSRSRWRNSAGSCCPGPMPVGTVILAVTSVVCSAVLASAWVWGSNAILGQLAGLSVAFAYTMSATWGTFGFQFDVRKCREMLAFSVPLVPSTVGVFLNLYADRLVIQHTTSVADVGLYGVGYRIAR